MLVFVLRGNLREWEHIHMFTEERLDRALANREWCSLFPYVTVNVLAASSSDHNPILVHFNEFQKDQ
jgi:endonuclease/exonuclease/phosphatase (EEP) superfamily protein YafD